MGTHAQLDAENFKMARLPISMAYDEGLHSSIERLCKAALAYAKQGVVLLVLSDRSLEENQLPVPMVLIVSAINQQLVDHQFRCDVNILVETASTRDAHQCAVLLGFGATAIFPYLACETLRALCQQGVIHDMKAMSYCGIVKA